MAKVTGVVEFSGVSKFNKEDWTIAVDGTWYNQKIEWLDEKPEKGDEVEFDNGGRKYIKFLKILSSGNEVSESPKKSGGGSGKPAFKKGGNGFVNNTLGIELGHAANNAVALAVAEGNTDLDYVRGLTKDFYEMMKGLRAEYEGAEEVPKATKKASPVKKEPAPKAEPVVEDDFDEDPF